MSDNGVCQSFKRNVLDSRTRRKPGNLSVGIGGGRIVSGFRSNCPSSGELSERGFGSNPRRTSGKFSLKVCDSGVLSGFHIWENGVSSPVRRGVRTYSTETLSIFHSFRRFRHDVAGVVRIFPDVVSSALQGRRKVGKRTGRKSVGSRRRRGSSGRSGSEFPHFPGFLIPFNASRNAILSDALDFPVGSL